MGYVKQNNHNMIVTWVSCNEKGTNECWKGPRYVEKKQQQKEKNVFPEKSLVLPSPLDLNTSAKTKENLIQQINLVFLGTIGLITLTETREKRNVILHFRERFDVITSTEI